MIISYTLDLDFSYHVSYSDCQTVSLFFSSFSYHAYDPRRGHSSEWGNPAFASFDQLHFWLAIVQHSYFVAVIALKNISVRQHAHVGEHNGII